MLKNLRLKIGSLLLGLLVLFGAESASARDLTPEDTLECMERVLGAPRELQVALHSKCVQLTASNCDRQKVPSKCYAQFGTGLVMAEWAGGIEEFACPAEFIAIEGACGFLVPLITMQKFYLKKTLSGTPSPLQTDAASLETSGGPSIIQCLSAIDSLFHLLRGNLQTVCLTSVEKFCGNQEDSVNCFEAVGTEMADKTREILKLLPEEIVDKGYRKKSYRRGLERHRDNEWEGACEGDMSDQPELCEFGNQFLAMQDAFWLARMANVTSHLE